MIGYSSNGGRQVDLHPEGCRCKGCIDVAIVFEDNEAIGVDTYFAVRRGTGQPDEDELEELET